VTVIPQRGQALGLNHGLGKHNFQPSKLLIRTYRQISIAMSPFEVGKYILTSALFVLSLFFALRLLFAHDLRRDAWRSTVKHTVYISRAKFKVWSILLGWFCLFVALLVAYFQIDRLITNQ
jgi:hypothetical protein